MATPNDTTDNYGFQLWAKGQTDWEHRTDFRKLDDLLAEISAGSSGDGATAGPWAVPSGRTVADIADALADNGVVQLEPGVTYTHDGSSSITHTNGDRHQVVFAHGATIEVRGDAVVECEKDKFKDDSFAWYGGTFEGTQSRGEVAFNIADISFGVFKPRNIFDCEVGMVLRNEASWCEFCDVDFRGRFNRVTLALLGGGSGGMPGRSIDTPHNGGTPSFRDMNMNVAGTPRGESGAATAVVWTDATKCYASEFRIEANRDTDVVGLRLHENFPGTLIHIHTETPASRVNGVGIQVDRMIREPMAVWHSSSTAGGGRVVRNNTSEPWFDCSHPKDGTPEFGPVDKVDGSTAAAYRTDIPSPDGFGRQVQYPMEFLNSGSANRPAVRLGTDGAGLYARDGEVHAVNSSGNSTRIT